MGVIRLCCICRLWRKDATVILVQSPCKTVICRLRCFVSAVDMLPGVRLVHTTKPLLWKRIVYIYVSDEYSALSTELNE